MHRIVPLVVVVAVVFAGCAGSSGGPGPPNATPSAPATHTPDVTRTATSLGTAGSTDATETTRKSTAGTTGTTVTTNENASLLSGGLAGGEGLVPANERGRFPTFVRGLPVELDLSVTNDEGKTVNYTTVIQLQKYDRTESDGNATFVVTDRRTLARSSVRVEDGKRVETTYNVTVNRTGTHYQLAFLLYRSDPSTTPRFDTADNASFVIPVNVTDAAPTT